MKQLISVYIIFFLITSLFAQNNLSRQSIFESLQYKEVTNITIKTDLDSLINVRRRKSYQAGKFSYKDDKGKKITRDLKIRPRGKYRRRICDFPTVKLNFSKKELKADGLTKYDDYKLVTHCLDDKIESKENVLREYLIYKMYNILSEKSYQVQYLKITYIDSKKKLPKLKRTGFVIEDTGELAHRIGAKILSAPNFPMDSFNMEQLNFVALFQYMVGNLDWKASPFTKNVKVMKYEGDSTYQIIPYDFDFSGLVSTSYLRLAEHLNQKSARQRIFLGQIKEQSDLKNNIALYKSKKEELLNYIDNFKLLSEVSRDNIRTYIESFYEDIADGRVETVE